MSNFRALNRYFSMATLIVSNVGYFRVFSLAECQRYYIVAPVFKGEVHTSRCIWVADHSHSSADDGLPSDTRA